MANYCNDEQIVIHPISAAETSPLNIAKVLGTKRRREYDENKNPLHTIRPKYQKIAVNTSRGCTADIA